MADRPLTNWNSGLFNCCDDISSCCYGYWCCPCLACSVSGKFGENQCLPICDFFSPAFVVSCGIPLCAPPVSLAMRVGIRNRYGIKGNICKDIAITCFCVWCSWCQMHRELKHRKETSTVIGMQPDPQKMHSAQQMMQPNPHMMHSAPHMMQPNPHMMQSAPQMMQPDPYMMQPAPQMMQSAPQMMQSAPQMMQPGPGYPVSTGFVTQ